MPRKYTRRAKPEASAVETPAHPLAWLENLPEVGAVRRFASTLDNIATEIARLEKTIADLRLEAAGVIDRANVAVAGLWTQEEIAAAKGQTVVEAPRPGQPVTEHPDMYSVCQGVGCLNRVSHEKDKYCSDPKARHTRP